MFRRARLSYYFVRICFNFPNTSGSNSNRPAMIFSTAGIGRAGAIVKLLLAAANLQETVLIKEFISI